MRAVRNIYVKDQKQFPYHKLSGSKILTYTGKIFYYSGSLPSTFDAKEDIAFDCDCEYKEWQKIEKVFRKRK